MDQLWAAVVRGYGADITDVDFDTTDYDVLTALEKDVVKFSSAKDEVMNKAIYRELIDSDGNIRSFSEFKTAAHEITNEQVHTWLKAEYNLAITSAQASAKWVAIEKNKSALPLLQFDAIIDSHTTEICRTLNGVTLPIDDTFWDEYYIPNHYGERSTIRQLAEGELTDKSTIVYPEKIPAIFKVNLAKLKMVFPPGHPYYGK